MVRWIALLVVVLWPCAVLAQEDAVSAHLSFSVYGAGLHAIDLEADAALGRGLYRVDLSYKTVGLLGVVMGSQINSFVQGRFVDREAGGGAAVVEPIRFASWGQYRGVPRRTTLDYRGGQPVITALEPAQDDNRDPVPRDMQRDTIDTLSSMALLVRGVSEGGTCDGRQVTFDGRRVFEITSRTVGMETLAREGRSSFSGPALRCDFEGRQLAGFFRDASPEELTRIHRSSAWLARVVPGAPALPVRVQFETRYFGYATAYLTRSFKNQAVPPTLMAQPKP